MLYHLICLNPHKDITLHVSVNSPAMVRHFFPVRLSQQLNSPHVAPL